MIANFGCVGGTVRHGVAGYHRSPKRTHARHQNSLPAIEQITPIHSPAPLGTSDAKVHATPNLDGPPLDNDLPADDGRPGRGRELALLARTAG